MASKTSFRKQTLAQSIRYGLVVLVALAISIGGCATVAERATDLALLACLPPGIAALPPSNEVRGMKAVLTPAGTGVLVRYPTMHVVIANGMVLSLDPEPEKPVGPVWVRNSLTACEWHQQVVGGQGA